MTKPVSSWVPVRVRLSDEDPLAAFALPVREISPSRAFRAMMPAAAAALVEPAAEEEAAGLADAEQDHIIPVPDLPNCPTSREKAEKLLRVAAGIEHGLLAQYLFAAYSLDGKKRKLEKEIIRKIAVEEMGHLMTVQNLLKLIGASGDFHRADRQVAEGAGSLVPFDLQLEKFSKQSLAKYVVAESPHNAEALEPRFKVIKEIAGDAFMARIKQVGLLYALLGAVFGTKEILDQRALAGNPWDVAVNRLANWLSGELQDPKLGTPPDYGGRDGLHLKDADLVSSPPQATDPEWDRSTDQRNFLVGSIPAQPAETDPLGRHASLDALREISIQGEGTMGTATDQESHYQRFQKVFFDLYRFDGQNPEPDGVFPVPSGAKIAVGPTATGNDGIRHPQTIPWATLADYRYWLLLGFLEQYVMSPPDDREFLASWCFSEMYHLKKLTEYLTGMPSQPDLEASQAAASLPFNLPPVFPSEQPPDPAGVMGNRTAWSPLLESWLGEAIAITESLLPTTTDPTDADKRQFLDYMLLACVHSGGAVMIESNSARTVLLDGDKVRYFRQQKGLSQQGLADEITRLVQEQKQRTGKVQESEIEEISRKTISAIENYRHGVLASTHFALAKGLVVEPKDLLPDKDTPPDGHSVSGDYARGFLTASDFAQTLLEAIPLPIFYKDAEGRYLGCNEAFCKFLDKDRADIVGHGVSTVSVKTNASMYEKKDLELMEYSGEQIYRHYVLTPQGNRDVVFFKATFPHGATLQPEGIVGVVVDVVSLNAVPVEAPKE